MSLEIKQTLRLWRCLSRGGTAALDFAIAYHGLVVAAGGVWGFDYPSNDPREDALFEKEAALKEARDLEGLAELNVRIWGDGPLQEPSRVSNEVREKLYKWCIDIARKECDEVDSSAFRDTKIDPPAGKRLSELKIPVAVAIGLFDETCTNAGMTCVANQVENSELREFETAHMINLELPREFNSWLETWLDKHFAHERSFPPAKEMQVQGHPVWSTSHGKQKLQSIFSSKPFYGRFCSRHSRTNINPDDSTSFISNSCFLTKKAFSVFLLSLIN